MEILFCLNLLQNNLFLFELLIYDFFNEIF